MSKGRSSKKECKQCGSLFKATNSVIDKIFFCSATCREDYFNTELVGKRFGRWSVIKRGVNRGRIAMWECRCDCGIEKTISSTSLHEGTSKSCGCLQRELQSNRQKTHGRSKDREYKVWAGMKNRCNNKDDPSYDRYGGRGIKVCKKWKRSFEDFISDIGGIPKGLSIDRIDVNGDYEPDNVRVVDMVTQQRNRRDNRVVEIMGVSKCIAEWAEIHGIKQSTIHSRIRRGMKPIDAILAPVESGHITESAACAIADDTVRNMRNGRL